MVRAVQPLKPFRRSAGRGKRASVIDSGAAPFAPLVARRSVSSAAVRTTTGNGGSAWQFLCLVEIANFSALRRNLGRAGAANLIFDLDRRIDSILPDASTVIVSRTVVEVSIERDSFAELQVTMSALSAVADTPFVLETGAHAVLIAIGAAAARRDTAEGVRLIEEAEGALEDARGNNQPVLRDLSVCTPTFDRQTLTRELPQAIVNGEMFLQYQPKVHVREQKISSAEALVRWQHPNRGLILPGDFITVAEQALQISALTLWTLDEVIKDQKALALDGHDLTIFINISGQLLSDKHFVDAACAKIHDCGAKIGFEITETAVIRDPECAIANLQIFADKGIVIAIDDYGAGLSSLAYLKQLPARELKIDKMFVLQLTSSNRDPLIVRSTIDLAHALDMEVTAEGVETQAAMALLSVMGCDMVQGYLISRPISIDAFRSFLHEYRNRPVEDTRQSMFKRPATFWKSA